MDNRSNILSCSLQLFSARGYDSVGVQEIAEVSGVTKPTLYHYFGSKKGLLDALLKNYFDKLHDMVIKSAEYEGDLPLTLNKLAFCFLNFANHNTEFYRMQLGLYFAPPENVAQQAVRTYNEHIYSVVEELFIKAAKDHGNMKGRHKAYAATFIGMLNTYFAISINGYAEFSEDLVYKAVHQFMHGIYS